MHACQLFDSQSSHCPDCGAPYLPDGNCIGCADEDTPLGRWRDAVADIDDTLTGFDRFQAHVGTWGVQAFPKSTRASIAEHLRREVVELQHSMDEGELQQEAADCLLLLLSLAHRQGFSLEGAARKKFAVCLTREWGSSDADGVVEHVREQAK